MYDQSDERRMTEAPIPSLILSLTLPSVLMMLTTAAYNVADAFFVSSLGTGATGALGCLFPLTAMIQTVGFSLGMGAGSLISRRLGEQKEEAASTLASSAFFLALLASALLCAAGLVFIRPLTHLLGATEELFEETVRCVRWLLIAAPLLILSFVLSNLLRSEGRTDLALWGMGLGSLLNIALDPLFIYSLGLGAAGPAAASVCSQAAACLLLLLFFRRRRTVLRLQLRQISRHPADYGSILLTGLPSLFRQGLAAVAAILLNRQAGIYGTEAIAAMGVVNKIFMVFFSVSLGLGQGYQPAAGYNYGADRPDRLRQALLFTLWIGVALLTLLAALLFWLAEPLLHLFTPDASVLAIARPALRALCLVLPLIPPSTLANLTCQAVGRPWLASLLAASRQGIFFLPLILWLPRCLGLTGVQIAQAGADLLTFLSCLPFLIVYLHRLSSIDRAKPA